MTGATRLKPYHVEINLPVGRDATWEAVTQPPVLRQWFGWDYDGLDAEIQQIFVDQAVFAAPEQMAWADGSYLEVTGDDDSSVVRAIREGAPPDFPDGYDAIEEGWKAFLTQLRFLLAERPEGRRRTLYLTGETTGRQTLELVDGDWRRVGSRVAWAVDADGHLVVAAGNVPLDAPEAAGMQVVVSTFGLADGAFATCHDDWAKRWAPVADGAAVTTANPPSS